MIGLVLNEDGNVTYPFQVFRVIESQVRSLNWRVFSVECGGITYEFPFEHTNDYFMDGNELFELLKEHPDIQWIWGALCGIPKEIPVGRIKQSPVIDLTEEQPYLQNELKHVDPCAILEIVAFDSSETYVLVDDEELASELIKAFPKAESLEKYVYTE